MRSLTLLAAGYLALATPAVYGGILNGLVGYYPFDGNAADLSGNGYNGTAMNGVSYVNHGSGLAAHLNGSHQYISLPGSIPSSQDLTVAFWLRTSVSTAYTFPYGIFMVSRDLFDVNYDWNISLASGRKVEFQNGAPPAEYVLTAPSDLPANGWSHVACVFNSSAQTKSIYIDGVQVASGSWAPHAFANSGVPIYVGASTVETEYHSFLAGDVDELRIYNRPLTAGDIAQLVPEPSAWSILLLGLAGVVRRIRIAKE